MTARALVAISFHIRYFYLRLHYRTVRRDRMQRPKQEGTARNKFNQTSQAGIIRHAR